MISEKELLKMKEQIDESKTSISESKGHLSALMKQLKENWSCETVEKAEKKLVTMKKELEQMLSDIETASDELEEKLNQE